MVDETSTWPTNPKTYTFEDFLTTYGLESNNTLKFIQDKVVFRVDGTLSMNGDYYWYESRVARGTQHRRFGQVRAYSPSRVEWAQGLARAGPQGGLASHTYTCEDFRREHLEILDPGDNETTAAHREEARADYDRTLKQLRRAPARRSCPPWSIPGRLWLPLMWPTYVRRGKKAL